MRQGFKVVLSFLHNTFLINKYMSTTNKLLPHFIHLTRTSAQTQIKVVVN